jgi:hypothetical protein
LEKGSNDGTPAVYLGVPSRWEMSTVLKNKVVWMVNGAVLDGVGAKRFNVTVGVL